MNVDPQNEGQREMQLRAYDKLWENIIHKENRLWTFLAIYGVAVGYIVSQGSDDAQEYRNPAYAVVLLLTYWAVEIIIDSDWWSVRNRLMIGGIERGRKEALRGVIPDMYNSVGYRGESLHTASIVVVVAVGVISYFLAMRRIFERSDSDIAVASWSGVLFLAAVLATMRCVHMREKRVREYYITLRDLNAQQERFTEEAIQKGERSDVRKLGRRGTGFLLYIICALTLLAHAWEDMGLLARWTIVLSQLLLVTIYAQQYGDLVSMQKGCTGFSLFFSERKGGASEYLGPELYICRNRRMLALLLLMAFICAFSVATLPK